MTITFEHAPKSFDVAVVVDELPQVGKSFICESISAAEIKAIEPYPYRCPQQRQENYLYSLWKITYRPMNLIDDACAYVAIHEKEAEKI